MLKNMIAALMIFSISSCRSFERQLICGQIQEHQIKPHELCDISFQFNRCRCREFDFNTWEALSEPENRPLEYCEGIAGFHVKDIATDIRPNVKALDEIKNNLCGQ